MDIDAKDNDDCKFNNAFDDEDGINTITSNNNDGSDDNNAVED